MIARADITAHARSWLGVPYRHQGRARTGVDCLGYVRVVLDHFHLWPASVPDPLDYRREPDDRMMQTVKANCERLTALREGCLILIRWPGIDHPTHIGFYSKGNMLHCYERAGGVVEHGFRPPWTRITFGLFQIPGVE